MRARAAVSAIVAGLVVLGTAGCNYFAPQATTFEYDPSDGVGGETGDILVRNALFVSEDGESGVLAFTLLNTGDRNVRVTVEAGEGAESVSEEVWLEAGTSKAFGSDELEALPVSGVDAPVGGTLPVYLQYGDVQGTQLLVPVLDATLPEYAALLPDEE